MCTKMLCLYRLNPMMLLEWMENKIYCRSTTYPRTILFWIHFDLYRDIRRYRNIKNKGGSHKPVRFTVISFIYRVLWKLIISPDLLFQKFRKCNLSPCRIDADVLYWKYKRNNRPQGVDLIALVTNHRIATLGTRSKFRGWFFYT